MAGIAYLLLCHKDPEAVIAQARLLSGQGDHVAVHVDGRAPQAVFEQIRAGLGDRRGVVFTPKRQKCGWGDWSLVAATLETARTALAAFPEASHFYLISGDCLPIKPASFVHAALAAGEHDYIESVDFFTSGWIKTGMRDERLTYRHWFNERRHKIWFYRTLEWQKRLGLRRALPKGLSMRIGSQWWCLRRQTLEAVFAHLRQNPQITRFFRRSWIPDETFFQTLVHHLVPDAQIHRKAPSFLMFTDYGMPVNFYDDHYAYLLAQDAFFARKISPEAGDLRARLGALYGADAPEIAVTGEGEKIFRYLTGRGRHGRRHGPRIWEEPPPLGRESTLVIVVCRQWHLAKALAQAAVDARGHGTALGYVFDEESCPLPDLGGYERGLDKRLRHRRALLRMLIAAQGGGDLTLCLDPSKADLIADLAQEVADLRVIEIESLLDAEALLAHAARSGLVSSHTAHQEAARLLPSLQADLVHERAAVARHGGARLYRLRAAAPLGRNADALAAVFDLGPSEAMALAQTPHLLSD